MRDMLAKMVALQEEQFDNKAKCFTDVLIIFSNADHSLQQKITRFLFEENGQGYHAQVTNMFIKRNLICLKEFDSILVR